MRYKPEHKEETHRRIVEAASEQFRTYGFEGIGIAKLMGELHLTHGGFYAHFSDKEALVVESSAFALEQSKSKILTALKSGGIPAVLDFYLSQEHCDHPAIGCPLPALSADIARHSLSARAAFSQTLCELFNAIAEYLPGRTAEEKYAKAVTLLTTLAGAVSLARAVSDAKLSQTILASARGQILSCLAAKDE